VFQYVFAYWLGWFEISGYLPGIESIGFLALPWIIFIVVGMGPDVRLYRGILLDEATADYVRTAKAKGLPPSRIMGRHILRNAMIPVLTYTITQVPFLLLGAFLMERYFSLPGIGDLLVRSTYTSDLPILKGLSVLIAVTYAFLNVLTDILYAWADPRVRLS
jgi:peptide/nickel transport system permease protein